MYLNFSRKENGCTGDVNVHPTIQESRFLPNNVPLFLQSG